MHVGRIRNATRVLGAPFDWDPKVNGQCGGLPIRDEITTAGPTMRSAWFPTPAEIDRINAGAPVELFVIGNVHPPVALSVGARPTEDDDNAAHRQGTEDRR